MFLSSLRYSIFNIYRRNQIKKHTLNYLFWECTLRCNLNCLHCGSDCTKDSSIKDMSVEDFAKVLEDIKQNNKSKRLMVCITGGEPLLRKDLEDAGKEIISRGFNWGIVTNGLAFSKERFISLVKSGMGSISFSLDGFEKEHTYLRQNSVSFKKVEEAIKVVRKFQDLNPNRFVMDVITCVHKNNLGILREFRDYLIDSGVEQWRIFSIFPEGRASENDLSLNQEEYISLMEFIAETRKYKNAEGKGIHLNYSCEGYLGKWELKVRDYYFFCQGGIHIGSVMCDGNVSACLSVRAKDFIQGNIYESDFHFMDIWNNKYQNLRDRSWAKKHKCASCKSWSKCQGNGLHLHPDLTSPVSHCNLELLGLKK